MRRPRRTLVSLLGAAVLAASFAAPAALSAQSWRTVTQSRQVSGEREMDVRVTYAAGHFRMQPAAEGVLYRMSLRYDEDKYEPVSEYRDGRLRLGIDGSSRRIRVGKGDAAGNLDLDLATSLPMDLRLKFGAVKADLDLGGLALTHLEMTTGASQTRLDVSRPNPVALGTVELKIGAAQFLAERLGNLNMARLEVSAGVGDIILDLTGHWQRDARVSVQMGVGSLEFRVPEGLGFALSKHSFLATLDAEGLVKRGDSYYSPGFDDAERKVEVEVEAALGKISVVVVRNR